MELLSIIIPSRTEKYLNNTIKSVLENATEDIEVFPILDGYAFPPTLDLIRDPRLKYICLPDNGTMQKRQGINAAVSIANGKYVMCLDAHCLVAKGFDAVLKKDCNKDWVVIPRRYKLDADTWTTKNHLDGSLPVDYEYWMYREYLEGFLKPYRWDCRSVARKNIQIDETMTMQASCWFMHKTYFKELRLMQVEGYTGWGQEDVEIAMKVHTSGGKLMVNKNTWYAHLYKGKQHGRMYVPNKRQWAVSRLFGFNYWAKYRKSDFKKVISHFMPVPNWGEEWNQL
jgi:hypothetical protein